MTSSTLPLLSAYLEKLERRRVLFSDERAALLALPGILCSVGAQERVLKEDQNAHCSVFLIDGLVTRQKRANRSDQIIAISFPGDGVDLQSLFFDKTDHSLVAHETSVVAYVPHGALIELCDHHPHLAKMLWHDTLVERDLSRMGDEHWAPPSPATDGRTVPGMRGAPSRDRPRAGWHV